MQILWDTLDGGKAEIGGGTVDISRGGLVTDIPASDLSDPLVLLRALDEALATAGVSAPGTVGTVLTGLLATAAKGTNQARIVATYSAPQNNPSGGGVRWVVEDEGQLNSEHTELDLLGEPLHTEYTPPVAAAGGGGGAFPILQSVPAQAMTYPFSLNARRPVRVLSINGYMVNKPAAAVKECEGCVNALEWPSGSLFRDERPKDKGCWLCGAVNVGVDRPGLIPQARGGQLYRVSARFMSRGRLMDTNGFPIQADRNWCDFGVHKNLLGRIPEDMLAKAQVAKVRALMQKPYSVLQDHSVNGYTRVGLFPIADFRRAFGF